MMPHSRAEIHGVICSITVSTTLPRLTIECFHHIGIYVPDLAAEIAEYAEKGIGVIQTGESEHVQFAYMDTGKPTGVIVEILERR